jgi:hypothetical protein
MAACRPTTSGELNLAGGRRGHRLRETIRAPGLAGYPESDRSESLHPLERRTRPRVGKGKLYTRGDIKPPDPRLRHHADDANPAPSGIAGTARATKDANLFFVANTTDQPNLHRILPHRRQTPGTLGRRDGSIRFAPVWRQRTAAPRSISHSAATARSSWSSAIRNSRPITWSPRAPRARRRWRSSRPASARPWQPLDGRDRPNSRASATAPHIDSSPPRRLRPRSPEYRQETRSRIPHRRRQGPDHHRREGKPSQAGLAGTPPPAFHSRRRPMARSPSPPRPPPRRAGLRLRQTPPSTLPAPAATHLVGRPVAGRPGFAGG